MRARARMYVCSRAVWCVCVQLNWYYGITLSTVCWILTVYTALWRRFACSMYYTVHSCGYMCRVTYFSISMEQREKCDETTPLQLLTDLLDGKRVNMRQLVLYTAPSSSNCALRWATVNGNYISIIFEGAIHWFWSAKIHIYQICHHFSYDKSPSKQQPFPTRLRAHRILCMPFTLARQRSMGRPRWLRETSCGSNQLTDLLAVAHFAS